MLLIAVFVSVVYVPCISSINYKGCLYISISNSMTKRILSNTFLKSSTSGQQQPASEFKSASQDSREFKRMKLRETLENIKLDKESLKSTETKEDREKEVNSWRVVLYNDDIHNFNYVTESISTCIPQLSLATAYTITMEAHKMGQATILYTWKDKAEAYCREMQKFGLTVCSINDTTRGDKSRRT